MIHVADDIAHFQRLGLLEGLLFDRTTRRSIIWGTDAYAERGEGFQKDCEIQPSAITAENAGVISLRAEKPLYLQSSRTKQHGEVFTPVWMCRKMNDYLDEVWPESTWTDYVDSKRLEITCGEAPFLASRYDPTDGSEVPLEERCGLLDRKLRIVDENAHDEEAWLKWAFRALESVYGYEFQGDSLLIARMNLIRTFEDNLEARWNRVPSAKEYRRLARTVSWNIWQMDGLTSRVPYSAAPTAYEQLSLFDAGLEPIGASETPSECRIFDWRSRVSPTYREVQRRTTTAGRKSMKFDYVIGNPPYQDESNGEGRNYAQPIYHEFIDEAYKIGDKVELIHPARFLFNAGDTPAAWNKKMLNDPHLKVLWYEQDCNQIFSNTDIKGGIAVTYRDRNANFGAIKVFTKYSELNSILQKVAGREDFQSLCDIIYSRTSYRLTKKMHEENPFAASRVSKGHDYDMSSNIFGLIPEIFYDVMPDDGEKYIRIIGRLNNQRVEKYIKRNYVKDVESLDSFKLFVAQANGSGLFGEALSPSIIAQPGEGHTESFLSIGNFATLEEAENLNKYVSTKFLRALLGAKKVTQNGNKPVWQCIPLQDFTPTSDIDWSQSIAGIDRQLYRKYGLDESEIEFIESHVKEMA